MLRLHLCGGESTLASRLRDEGFAVADTPGLAQSPRGLVMGAWTADATLIVVDAAVGVTPETRRASFLVSSLGVRPVVLVVNGMELVGHAQAAFARVDEQYRAVAAGLGLAPVAAIPVSAATGEKIRQRSAAMPWYEGPTLGAWLDGLDADGARLGDQPLRLPIRSLDAAGPAGTIVAGRLRQGDAVRVQPSGRVGRVRRVVAGARDVDEAGVGQAVAIALDAGLDVAPGDLVVAASEPAEVADQFEATVVWTSDTPLFPGRGYRLQIGALTATATVTLLKHKLDPAGGQRRVAAARLDAGDVGVCNLHLDRPIAFDPYRVNRHTGGFVLTDRLPGGDAAGVGMLHFALRRAHNVHWQALDVNKAVRAAIKGQRACVLWYTGLSGAGKSTIANLVDRRLHSLKRHTYLLDGDNVRHGLNKDLGFTDADRVENIRRIAEVAKLMVDAGLMVGTAFISPFRAEREMARALLADGEFVEIFVDTPLAVAEQRDPKGLYKKARRGDLKNFTGIDSPYEPPPHPELRIDTTASSPEDAAEAIVAYLEGRGFLGS